MLKLCRRYKYFTIEYEQLATEWFVGRVFRNGGDLIAHINRTTKIALMDRAIYEIESHIRYEKKTLRAMIGLLSRKTTNV